MAERSDSGDGTAGSIRRSEVVAVVTGAASGIGRALAERFAASEAILDGRHPTGIAHPFAAAPAARAPRGTP